MFDLPEQRTEDRGQRTGGRAPLAQSLATVCPHARRGVTLLELLVVISIMMMLAAYALPKLAPMARERKIRETARSVSVFLSRARSRAIETGRPCGVVFQRFDNNTSNPLSNAATMLYQAEVPPPYAGDTLSARVRMSVIGSTLWAHVASGSIQPNLLRVGDLIQINNQGPWHTITGPDFLDINDDPNPDGIIDGSPITYLTLSIDRQYQKSIPPWPPTAELPFKILRQPVRTIAQPLSLPVGAAVDLSVSGTDQFIDTDGDGIGDTPIFGTGTGDVVIMFSPNGSVSRYYWDIGGAPHAADAADPIFLLVGWRENIALTPVPHPPGDSTVIDEDDLPNWQILSNLWIGLNSQSGLVTVAENFFPERTYQEVQGGMAAWSNYKKWAPHALIESRGFARRAQSKGGR